MQKEENPVERGRRKTEGQCKLKEDEDEEEGTTDTEEVDEETDASNSSSTTSTTTTTNSRGTESWIDWFLGLPGHQLLARIPQEFMQDEFNLTELASRVPHYRAALALLLDNVDMKEDVKSDGPSDEGHGSAVKSAAKMLYTLIHARFVGGTKAGLAVMAERYQRQYYGVCPRYFCARQRVLPVGLSETPCQARVQVYCPSCNDVYQLPSLYHRVDGAAFGVSFPHLFFKAFPHLLRPRVGPKAQLGDGPPGGDPGGMSALPPLVVYEPKIFGFALHRRRQPNVAVPLSSSAVVSSQSSLGIMTPETVSFSLYPLPEANLDHSVANPATSLSKFGLPLHLYRNYIPNPYNMSWLRTKPNPYRS